MQGQDPSLLPASRTHEVPCPLPPRTSLASGFSLAGFHFAVTILLEQWAGDTLWAEVPPERMRREEAPNVAPVPGPQLQARGLLPYPADLKEWSFCSQQLHSTAFSWPPPASLSLSATVGTLGESCMAHPSLTHHSKMPRRPKLVPSQPQLWTFYSSMR